ncbi:MAG: hypothetical protein NTV49_15230 [Kiritimatiellaeota bacterium]|nr:hypothetical protein [Kiritimatiellota bacterium]
MQAYLPGPREPRRRATRPPWRGWLGPGMVLLACLVGGCRQKAARSPAGGTTLTANVSTNVIRIGDLLRLRVTAEHPAGYQVLLPNLARDKAVIVRDQQQQTQPLPAQRARTTCDYVITSLVTGQYDFVTNRVTWQLPDGQTQMTNFPFAAFTVHSTLTGTNQPLRDIHGLAHWPGRFPPWLSALLIAAALAGLAVVLFRLYRRRPSARRNGPPPLPPHQVALAALQALLRRGWIEAEHVEPFYVELSAIVRRYLEDRFQLRAPERTTEEFLREAATAGALTPAHQALVGAFLEQSDLVKFARYHPPSGAMRAAYAAAERLVQETIPIAPAAPGAAP